MIIFIGAAARHFVGRDEIQTFKNSQILSEMMNLGESNPWSYFYINLKIKFAFLAHVLLAAGDLQIVFTALCLHAFLVSLLVLIHPF